MICVICKKKIKPDKNGWAEGHNPAPISNDINHRCCAKCNLNIVLPARFAEVELHEKGMYQTKINGGKNE